MKLSLSSGVAIFWFATTSQAHTWLENLRLIASNGSFIGPIGFARGHVARAPGVAVDAASVFLINNGNNNTDTPMCRAEQQAVGKEVAQFPALKAAPGDKVALRYLENGHVTKLEPGRPARSGMVFVYGTKEPIEKEKFNSIHRVWNAAGTGGDKRGRLLATRPYDDGQCYQPNNGQAKSQQRVKEFPISDTNADLLCQTDIQIPADAGTSGDYALYWVWEWPLTSASGQLVPETYTACADIQLGSTSITAAGAFKDGQPFDQVAIAEQLTNQFILDPASYPATTTAPPFSMGPGAPSSAAPVVSSPSKQTSAAPSPSTTSVKTSSAPPSKVTSIPAQGFLTVTVTVTPDEKQAPVTVTDYIIVKPDATTIAKGTITGGPPSLTPLPASDFIGSRTTSASAKPVQSSLPSDGSPPSVIPFLPGTSSTTKAADRASTSTTSNAVVPRPTSTTSNAVVPLPTAPANGTAPLSTGRYARKRAGGWARLG